MTAPANATTYLASRPRYEILDGLRGVAALLVVAFHLLETYSGGPVTQVINHGYLAVDFFFALSGFVIGYAYDERLASGKINVRQFLLRRVIRLHPMVIVGATLGLMLVFLGGGADATMMESVPWWRPVALCLLACLMIPVTSAMDVRGWGESYPLNGPQWSLMYEYIANLLYVFIIRRLGKVALAVCVAIFGLLTLTLTFKVFLPDDYWSAYTVIGGWGVDCTSFYIGFTRLLYPFFAGLLISRMGRLISLRGGFWWCSLIVAAALAMPRVGGTDADNFWMNGLYESICIIIVFPLVVAMGAGSKVTDARSMAVCKWLGDISFPLYITHYPFIYVQIAWANSHPEWPASHHAMVSIGIYVLTILVAYSALHLFDEPVRARLISIIFKKK